MEQRNDKEKVYLSVVMPAYNEAEKINENIVTVVDTLEKIVPSFEVVVVDDGSKDSTYSEIEKAAVKDNRVVAIQSPQNVGKGGALKLGTAKAQGELIAFLDADLDLSPEMLEDFLKKLEENDADAVIGSKMHEDSKLNYPGGRKAISHIYYYILYILFHLRVHDTQTGIKLFRAAYIQPVMRKILVKRFAYDIEVLAVGSREGKKIVEAPIELNYSRERSWGRITFKDLVETGLDTLAVFYRLRILKYYDKIQPENICEEQQNGGKT